ncbi:MAG: hypothetical protein GXY88_00440 [Tissierellia bacterium]|nr:hypothetical protein [Tissierellia bacterium]
MKTNGIKKGILALVVLSIILGGSVVFSEPGSEKDPLISLSFLEKRLEQFKNYIDERLANVDSGSNSYPANRLEVVEIAAGQSLIGKAGTEIILRGGKARVIAGELGGLSDVTGGKDLGMDVLVPDNHLLIVPRNDNRGVAAITDAIFLVRGEYEIR